MHLASAPHNNNEKPSQFWHVTYTQHEHRSGPMRCVVGYAMPLILLILPGSVSCTGRRVLRIGQEKVTSPPPPGAMPLFTTWGRQKRQREKAGSKT